MALKMPVAVNPFLGVKGGVEMPSRIDLTGLGVLTTHSSIGYLPGGLLSISTGMCSFLSLVRSFCGENFRENFGGSS